MKRFIQGTIFSITVAVLLALAMTVVSKASTVHADDRESPTYVPELESLARKMDSVQLTKNQRKVFLKKLALLTPEQVFHLRQLWREELVRKGELSPEEVGSFSILEKLDWEFYQKIEEIFGKGKTIYNISSEEFKLVENDFKQAGQKEISGEMNNFFDDSKSSLAAKLFGASCYYDNNWPNWLAAVAKSGTTYKGGGVGRVKSGPDEWPCDFVIYIAANRYTKVTGRNNAAMNVINYSGGLSASPSRDAVIVGYWRLLIYGVPTEDWVRNYILFKK